MPFKAAAKKFGLPLGAYLACDWETGDGNNVGAGKDVSARAILVFMDTVKAADYQPLLYSGAFLLRWNIDTKQILKKYPNCLLVASYATTGRIDTPNFNYFPSMDGVLIWQFTQNWYGVNVDANVAVLPLKKTVSESTGDDSIMNWNVKVGIDDAGGFMVTKKAGATVWTGPDNKKKTGKMLKYGTNWRVVDVKNGFYKVGTNQWVDARCGVFKMNPIRYQSIHAIVEVVGAAAGHAKPTAEVTGRTFKIGERLTISGRENHYLKIKGGSGKNAYVNGRKVKVIL